MGAPCFSIAIPIKALFPMKVALSPPQVLTSQSQGNENGLGQLDSLGRIRRSDLNAPILYSEPHSGVWSSLRLLCNTANTPYH